MVSLGEARQGAVRAYQLLDDDHPSRPELRGLVSLAAAACGVSMATINILTEDLQHQIESVGFTGAPSPRSDSMCAVVIDETSPLVLADARDDERFRDNPWVTGPASVRFYATFQLRTPSKEPIGSLCIFDSSPRVIGPAQRETLSVLAARIMDVLELELQRRLLHAANRELEAANERLAEFAATVSHELRGPLTTIQLALDLVAEAREDPDSAGSPEQVAGHVARARRVAGRMNGSIEHLLSTAQRPTAAAPDEVEWSAVVSAAIEDLGPELAGLELVVTPSRELLVGDPTGLRLAVQNLLLNAARYAGPSDPRVEIEVVRTGGGATLRVVDHGPGIAPDEARRIFETGQRGSVEGPGHGLGLATSRRLITDMGGRLDVRPTPGGGATFEISLSA